MLGMLPNSGSGDLEESVDRQVEVSQQLAMEGFLGKLELCGPSDTLRAHLSARDSEENASCNISRSEVDASVLFCPMVFGDRRGLRGESGLSKTFKFSPPRELTLPLSS